MEKEREELLKKLEEAPNPVPAKVFMVDPKYQGRGLAKQLLRLFLYREAYVGHVITKLLRRPSRTKEISVQTFWGKKLLLPEADADARVMQRLWRPGTNEDSLIKFLIRSLRSDSVFYDIGANYGFYTALAQQLITEGEIHAFEPNDAVFSYLEKSVGGVSKTSLNKLAVSDTVGELEFFDCADSGVSGKSTAVAKVAHEHRTATNKILVKATTLDEYCKEHVVPSIIKLDIEGYESSALSGAREALLRASPAIAVELWSGPELKEFSFSAIEVLEGLGYVPYRILDSGELKQTTLVDLRDFLSTPQAETNFVFKKQMP